LRLRFFIIALSHELLTPAYCGDLAKEMEGVWSREPARHARPGFSDQGASSYATAVIASKGKLSIRELALMSSWAHDGLRLKWSLRDGRQPRKPGEVGAVP
jgi:hypothetical protein